MGKTRRVSLFLFAVLAVALLGACGGPQVYRDEKFTGTSPYRHHFQVPVAAACDGARHALLNQGYAVDDTRPDHLKGVKAFQPEDDIHMVIEFYVVCTEVGGGTTMYANAVQSRYDLKKSRQTAGLAVPAVGAFAVPWGATEALVKVSGETITDEDLYDRFFRRVGQILVLPPK